ncbi:hypothetical protein ACH4C6_35980 [Streptomyces sp. NPDC017943]|uniref:hypothetical protein n=1 Tax=Streptomyces sp. NPDC017943 TaxID=3365019 RepID=UPI003791D324
MGLHGIATGDHQWVRRTDRQDICQQAAMEVAKGPELVLQGKFADAPTRAACSQDGPPADDEGIVRIPLSMVEQIRRACDAAEAAGTQL